MSRRTSLALLIGLGLGLSTASAAEPELFPFVLSYDAPENVASVASWLPRPAGGQGFVRVTQGRLATEQGPLRLWATNLCFEACFPSREQAERVAARLARLGVNCVRLHHMDSYSIWGASPNKLTIDPQKLDRLDYLIYQLKQHGVYVNINLHVSRSFGDKEGFPNREGRPTYDKGLDNFEPRMIELQRKYARDLLTHVNPYTRTAYVREPAVACVEINNENGLYSSWQWGHLDDLAEPYAGTFRQQWNDWLRAKYGTTAKLAGAWNVGARTLGAEMLINGDFRQPLEKTWNLERDEQTQVQWSIETGAGDQRLLRVVVTRQGKVAWHPQFHQAGFPVRVKTPYTLTFRARSEQPRKLSLNCMMSGDPWQQLGFHVQASLGPQWRDYRFTFVVNKDEPKARLSFSSLTPGTYEFAAVSLRPGGIVGLQDGQKLEDASVPVLRKSELNVTDAARSDFADFLWDTEQRYWSGMSTFLKDELGVRSLVAGTQLSYSPLHVQTELDFIDAHSYWHHPTFPNRSWDPQDWYVHNAALVNTPGGTLAGLAMRRVHGKAFTVSEYNHPAPIDYSAEGFPMIAAFGAFQGWDAIYSFAYSHNADWEPRLVNSFFDIKGETAKLVHFPACFAMFCRGDVAPAKETVRVPLSAADERSKLHETLDPWAITAERFGLDAKSSLLHAVSADPAGGQASLPKSNAPAGEYVSDTGQLRWNISQPGAGYFTVDTPRAKLFTGFVRGRTIQVGDMTLRIGATQLDWATVSLVAKDAASLSQPGHVLLAITGATRNSQMKFEQLGDDRVTVRNRWGQAPLLCEGVPAEIRLPVKGRSVQLYPLDEAGNRRAAVPCALAGGTATLRVGPEHRTVWYEVEIR